MNHQIKVWIGIVIFIFCFSLDASARTRKKANSVEKPKSNTESSQKFDGAKSLGVGGFIGTEIGVIGKYWLSADSPWAVQAAFGYDFSDDIMFFTEGLFHFKNLTEVRIQKPVAIHGYVGGGAKVIFDQPQVFFRIPVGADFDVEKCPMDAFFQLVPGIELSPKTAGKLDLEIGARYYF